MLSSFPGRRRETDTLSSRGGARSRIWTSDDVVANLVNFLLDELVLLAARELLRRRVRDLELAALLLGDAELRLRLPRLRLVRLVGLHRRVQLVQHPEDLLVRLVANLAALERSLRSGGCTCALTHADAILIEQS